MAKEGATAIQNVEDLEPVTAAEMPCPARFEGSFEAARAQAFLKSKLLVPGMPMCDFMVTLRGFKHDLTIW